MTALPILVIEDDPGQMTLLATMLSDEAYEVVTAQSGRQGLELLNKMVPALVVTDMVMPDVSGAQFIQAMRASKRLNLTPILIITSDAHIVTPEIRQLVDEVLIKPVVKATFVQIVRALLTKKTST